MSFLRKLPALQALRLARSYARQNGVRALAYKAYQKLYERRFLDYSAWESAHRATPQELQQQRSTNFPYMPLISIIVPVYHTPERFLRAMVESVQAQSYAHWELCVADGDADSETGRILAGYQNDNRIHIKPLHENLGIAGNTNAALQMAKGEYIALLDHDDLLAPDALFEIVSCLQASEPPIDFLYSDEDKVDASGTHFFDPHFKPGFSLELLRTSNYICHLSVIRRAFLQEHELTFRSGFDGAQDYDFILRCTETAERIHHIPRVLYHWRIHSASTAGSGGAAKPYTHEAGRRALDAHVKRMRIAGRVVDNIGATANFYRILYDPKPEKISVLLMGATSAQDTAAHQEKLKKFTCYDTFEIIPDTSLPNAVQQSSGSWIAVLDVHAMPQTHDWLSLLLGVCQQGGASIAGGKIINHSHRLLPIGWLRNQDNFIECYGNTNPKSTGYMRRLFSRQELSAVNPHLLFFSRKLYDELFPSIRHNLSVHWMEDALRLSLEASKRGKRVVYEPEATIHLSKYPHPAMQQIPTDGQTDIYGNPNYPFLKIYFSLCSSLGRNPI